MGMTWSGYTAAGISKNQLQKSDQSDLAKIAERIRFHWKIPLEDNRSEYPDTRAISTPVLLQYKPIPCHD